MTPSTAQQSLMHQFYCLIHSSGFALSKKRTLMTSVMGYEKWSWRVVGISEEAIRAIAKHGYRKPPRTLARDHVKPRAETYTKIFEGDLMPLEEWWLWVWEHDKTVLMTNQEHTSRSISRVYEIDWTLGLFQCAGLAGWSQTKAKEGTFLKNLVDQYQISI